MASKVRGCAEGIAIVAGLFGVVSSAAGDPVEPLPIVLVAVAALQWQEVPQGRPFVDRLRATNRGSMIWRTRGRRFGGQVTCGVKVCDASGNVLREDLGRTPLQSDVPNAVVELEIAMAGVLPPGEYELRYDMVVEGVTWFELQGSSYRGRMLTVFS